MYGRTFPFFQILRTAASTSNVEALIVTFPAEGSFTVVSSADARTSTAICTGQSS
jgi:hypothetical protein